MIKKHYLIPGPVIVPEKYMLEYTKQFSSPDLEDEFIDLYSSTQKLISEISNATENSLVIIQSGEAMVNILHFNSKDLFMGNL